MCVCMCVKGVEKGGGGRREGGGEGRGVEKRGEGDGEGEFGLKLGGHRTYVSLLCDVFVPRDW